MGIDKIREFNRARAAGLTPMQSARWAAYLLRFGYGRLSFEDAVAQVKAARRR